MARSQSKLEKDGKNAGRTEMEREPLPKFSRGKKSQVASERRGVISVS